MSVRHEHLIKDAARRATLIAKVYQRADAQLNEWQGPERGGNETGITGKGGHGDPTGQQVTGSDYAIQRRIQLHRLVEQLDDATRELGIICREVLESSNGKDPSQRGHDPCANQNGCPDGAWATKAGRCQRCYMYLYRNGKDRT